MFRILLPILFCLSCAAQQDKEKSVENKLSNWSKPDVEGRWELISTSLVKDIPFMDINNNLEEGFVDMEAGPFEFYSSGDLIFENDTLYKLDYPMEVFNQFTFSIDTGYLHAVEEDGYTNSYAIEREGDSLFVYVFGRYGDEYLKESYVKASFEDSLVNLLKRHGANYPELAGEWTLMRDYHYDYGTHFWLDFEHEMPDVIEISRDEFIEAQEEGYVYWLETDGKKRDYYFDYHDSYLYLTPGKWYEKEDPWIHFEKRAEE